MELCPRVKHTRGEGRKDQNRHLLRRLRILTPKCDCGKSLNEQRCNERVRNVMNENI